MQDQRPAEYLAECFWPGVEDRDLAALDERAEASIAALTLQGEHVRYLGSLLIVDDEVVLCRFEGTEAAVHRAAAQAAIPYERILKAIGSRWDLDPPMGEPKDLS
jgi:hypothetical protein